MKPSLLALTLILSSLPLSAAPVLPAMPRTEIEADLKSHDRALYIKEGWIRDPYNIGLGKASAVGNTVRVWKSRDLVRWESLGTAWSTDQSRKGSYKLYYSTADKITGPCGPRKFAGRFLGHGTPFQTRDGKWWCTAFFNANVPPLPREGPGLRRSRPGGSPEIQNLSHLKSYAKDHPRHPSRAPVGRRVCRAD